MISYYDVKEAWVMLVFGLTVGVMVLSFMVGLLVSLFGAKGQASRALLVPV